MRHAPRLSRLCLAASLIAVAVAAPPAFAIDRKPLGNGSAGEGPGYGAERRYSGAERFQGSRAGGKARYSGSEGSVVYFEDDDLYGGDDGGRAGVYPGFGASSDDGFVEDDADRWTVVVGPRIIDLRGRRPVGVETSHVGATRIVRIASDGDGATSSSETGGRPPRAPLEPWSEAWLRYCSRTHADFDPSRGTFVDDAGTIRFCTGE